MDSVYTSPYFIIKKLQRNCFQKVTRVFKGTVLDAGCGGAPFKQYLARLNYIRMDTLLNLRPTVCGSCNAIPFRNESFDTVLCTEVLEHGQDAQSAITEMKRVLKKGGYLYMSVPQSWPLHYEPHDYWRFTCYGLGYLLKNTGLRVVAIERIGGLASLLGQHLVDAAWTRIVTLFCAFGGRAAERLATLLCLPASVGFYFLGKIIDPIDKRFALGWTVLAKND